MSTGTAATALNTAPLAGNAALAKFVEILKDGEAELATVLPGADLTLLNAFVNDLAAQASGDPPAAAKLREDAKEALVKGRHFLAGLGHKAADLIDSTPGATQTGASTATVGPSAASPAAPASEAVKK